MTQRTGKLRREVRILRATVAPILAATGPLPVRILGQLVWLLETLINQETGGPGSALVRTMESTRGEAEVIYAMALHDEQSIISPNEQARLAGELTALLAEADAVESALGPPDWIAESER